MPSRMLYFHKLVVVIKPLNLWWSKYQYIYP